MSCERPATSCADRCAILYPSPVMRLLIAFAIFCFLTSAQAATVRVSPESASKHLSKNPQPKYPEVAERARIQGNVILQIRIDETGTASVQRLIQGHPLLAPAAIEAVNTWRYQPFEVEGKAAQVVTLVMVTFGNPANHMANDGAEMDLQDHFWTAEESADAAITRAD